MNEFRFQLGDVVVPKSAIEECRVSLDAGLIRIPKPGIVCERILQECPRRLPKAVRSQQRHGADRHAGD